MSCIAWHSNSDHTSSPNWPSFLLFPSKTTAVKQRITHYTFSVHLIQVNPWLWDALIINYKFIGDQVGSTCLWKGKSTKWEWEAIWAGQWWLIHSISLHLPVLLQSTRTGYMLRRRQPCFLDNIQQRFSAGTSPDCEALPLHYNELTLEINLLSPSQAISSIWSWLSISGPKHTRREWVASVSHPSLSFWWRLEGWIV